MSGCNTSKTIETWDSVHIIFTGNFEDQKMFETQDITIKVGSAEVISGIDSALIGMKEWEKKFLTLTPEDAYGKQYQKNKIQKLPKIVADELPSLQVDWEKTLGGLTWTIKWIETDDDGNEVLVFDLNAPETWKTLTYEVSVKNIEKK